MQKHPDSISLSSTSSAPGLTIHEDSVCNRVNSAPHLNLMCRETDKRNGPSTQYTDWTEVPIKESGKGLKMSEKLFEEEPSAEQQKVIDGQHHTLRLQDKKIKILKAECEQLLDKVTDYTKRWEDEVALRRDVEESIQTSSQESRDQVRRLTEKIGKLEELLAEEQSWRRKREDEVDNQLMQLSKERSRLQEESLKIKRELDMMKSLMERKRSLLNPDPALPCTVEGLKQTLERYREALVSFQVEKTMNESKLQSEMNFLKERIQADQVAKNQIEETLSGEVEDARMEINQLKAANAQLLKEITEKQDLKIQVEKDQLSIESIRSKSREIIKGLRDKLTTEVAAKEQLESNLAVTKNQLRAMQESLETSEQVQRDFVRLSQALQMQLEELRQKEEAKNNKTDNQSTGTSFHAPTTSHDDPS